MANAERIVIQRLPKSRVVATIRLDESEYAPAEDQALRNFSQHVEIKGFRPGNAPADMVRAKVPADQLFEEAVRILLRNLMPEVVEKHNVAPVIPPRVEVESRLPLTLKLTFIEKPEVTVKDVDNITIKKESPKADPKDVQRVLDSVLQEHRTLTEVDRESKTGDQVTIDFHSTDESGAVIEGMKAEGYGAVIGSASLLPGFEEQLTGLKKGDKKTFTLTLPEKFQAEELRGKNAIFHVTMQKVEDVKLPELNDAFAKEKLQAESADAFKAMVTESIESQEEQFMRMSRERELMEEIRKRTKVEIADELIEEEVRGMIEEWGERLERQGLTIADALKKDGKKPEDVEKEMRGQAEDRWKLRLGIAKIIEEKKIELTDDELNAAFERFMGSVPADQKSQAQAEWQKRGTMYDEIRWRTLVDKMIDMLLA